MKSTGWFFVKLVFFVALGVGILISTSMWLGPFAGLGITIGVIGGIFLQGLRKIPERPLHKGVLTFFGKIRQDVDALSEGWHFFLFYPFVEGVILIPYQTFGFTVTVEARTPDNARLRFPISVTCLPDSCAPAPYNYIRSGKKEGVQRLLSHILRERIRNWAVSSPEGPRTWQEAIASEEEATAILLADLLGNDIKPIPSSIPTPILLKALHKPPQWPTPSQAEEWGDNWEEVHKQLDQLSQEQREEVKQAVEERRGIIDRANRGDGDFRKLDLGVLVVRLNMGQITELGGLQEAASLRVREEEERRGETTEIEHAIQRVKEIMTDLNVSPEEAIRLFQTERGKVSKEIREKLFSISPDLRDTIKSVASDLLSPLARSRKEGENE